MIKQNGFHKGWLATKTNGKSPSMTTVTECVATGRRWRGGDKIRASSIPD